MNKSSPNLLQRIARKALREAIKEVNNKKSSKSEIRSSKSKIEKRKKTRSRYISASVRVSVLNRDDFKCVFCGRSSKKVSLEVDHIVPFSKGGSNKINNLQTLCFDCNRGKGSRQLN